MQKKEVLTFLSNCVFDNLLTEENFEDKIIRHLPNHDIEYHHGASKMVIIPKDSDFVIKIPFNGAYDGDFDDETGEWIETDFLPFEGAQNDCEEDDDHWDYCRAETLVYELAQDNDVEEFFCETDLLDFINGHPIYVQEKAEPYGSKEHNWRDYPEERYSPAEESCSSAGAEFYEAFWMTDAYEYYGKERFDQLATFLGNYNVEDLHDGNLGYIDDRPVIFDYSGWYD